MPREDEPRSRWFSIVVVVLVFVFVAVQVKVHASTSNDPQAAVCSLCARIHQFKFKLNRRMRGGNNNNKLLANNNMNSLQPGNLVSAHLAAWSPLGELTSHVFVRSRLARNVHIARDTMRVSGAIERKAREL